MTGPFLPSISVFIFSFFIILFCLVPCGRLSWLYVSFLGARKYPPSFIVFSFDSVKPVSGNNDWHFVSNNKDICIAEDKKSRCAE